jgi:hypothetical protein
VSDTTTLVRALRILARDIHCEDGIATRCITEAADEIERLRSRVRFCDNVIRSGDVAALTGEEREVLEEHLLTLDETARNLALMSEPQGEALIFYTTKAATLRGLLARTGGTNG